MARRDRPDEVPKARLTRSGLREVVHLLRYLRPYRRGFVAALTALFANNLLGLLFPFLAGRLVDAARPDAAPPDRWGPVPADLDSVALLLVGVLAVRAALAFVQTYWLAGVGERSLADLRRDAYGHLLSLPMAFFNDRRVGELAGRLAADLQQVQDALTSALPQLLRQLVLLVGGVVLLALTSGRLTLVMLASVPVLVTASVLFGRAVRRLARDAQDRLADANVVVEETLQGVAGVKAFNNEGFEVGRYTAGVGGYVDAVLRGALYRGAFSAFVTFALFGGVVLVLWSGANQVRAGTLTFGDLTQFLLYTLFVGGAVGSFAELYAQLQRTVGATERVRDLLRETPEVGGPTTDPPADGAVRLDGVEFSYPSRADVPVLRGLTLEARAGERVALVGPSGAGKSTVVNLLLRFFDPQAGTVRVGGRDARDYSLAALRSRLAVVPQDVLLFGGGIGENIAYGRPGASPAEVEAAARQANAHDFIVAFPDGYATLVGERGVKLSGGQRQRVAIARAILRDPAVLLLDEATSALDAESERLVQEALDRLMAGRTSVIVAHRLSTVRRADRIYVIKDGRVAESGTHAELLAHPGGVYRALTETQLGLG